MAAAARGLGGHQAAGTHLAREGRPDTPAREESDMADLEETEYGTYRCPVCNHRDGAEIRPGDAVGLIRCSYCGTSLELSPRGRDPVRFTVQVAGEHATR